MRTYFKEFNGYAWTIEEDTYLKNEYSKTSMQEMQTKLQRTKDAIYGRAGILKLRKVPTPYNYNTDKIKLSYLAGIIDGEGSISIMKIRGFYTLRLRVNNTNFELIDWLKINFGGFIYLTDKNGNRNAIKTWEVTSRKAATLLKEIQPLLIVKKEQAKIALSFQSTVTSVLGTNLAEEIKTEREEYRKQIMILNTKGVMDEKIKQLKNKSVIIESKVK